MSTFISSPFWLLSTATSQNYFSKQTKTLSKLEAKTHILKLNPMKGSSKKISKIVGRWKRKGHFVVYSKDNKRFLVPLCYLNHPIFRVLLEMAEEEYGLIGHGPLRIPCEKELVEYILCLLRKNPTEEVEKAVLSIATCRGASFQEGNRGAMSTALLSCN